MPDPIPPVVSPPAAVPPVAAPPAPAPEAIRASRGGLPESANIKIEPHDASKFFEAHEVANGKRPAPLTPLADAPAADAPAAKGSLAEKLAAKKLPPVIAPAPAGGAPETSPLDAITLDSRYSESARSSFDKLKTHAQGLVDQLNAARETERRLGTELTAAKSGAAPVDSEELTKLRTENQRLSDRLLVTDLREHPKFQAEFIAPQEHALANAQEILTAAGIADVKASDFLGKNRIDFGKAVSEAAKSLDPFNMSEFTRSMSTAWQIDQNAKAALGRSKEVYAGMRTNTVESQKSAFEKVWGRTAGHVNEHIVEIDVPEGATPEQQQAIEGYNTAFRGLRTRAEQIAFAPTTSEGVSENSIKAAAYDFHINQALPRILGEHQAALNEIRNLRAQIDGIRGRNPNIQIRGSAPAGSSIPVGDTGYTREQLSAMTASEAAAALAPRR